MEVEWPKGRGRIRARPGGYASPMTQRTVFRIEDEDGQVLRRIRDVRDAQEALALYWRMVGAVLPGTTMGKDLDRRINRARGAASRPAMQTPELPFTEEPAEDAPELPVATRRGRPKRMPAPVPQIDLFADEPNFQAGSGFHIEPTEQHDPEPLIETSPAATPLQADAEEAFENPVDTIEDEPPVNDIKLAEPAVAQHEPQPEPEIHLLDAQMVNLQRVDPRNLRPTDRPDSYLYHVTNGPDAEMVLSHGLAVSASDPMILTERQGVSYWLSVLAEDYDYIMDGPADFVVLRLRRMAVEELLENDPHASRSANCPCYLLTGGIAARERSEAAGRNI